MAGNQTKSESTLIKKVGDIANVMAAAVSDSRTILHS